MNYSLNDKELESNSNRLAEFLGEQDLLEKGGIAVAINGSVIPKSEWSITELNNNDKILIITATQGG